MSRYAPFRRLFVALVSAIGLVLVANPVWGQTPPAKKYPFAHPPVEIYDRLGKAALGKVEPLTEGDRKFLAEFWAARTATPAKAIPPADDAAVTAHLIASGVSYPRPRAEYLQKFNDLVAAAEIAVIGAKTNRAKADLLLRFLHKQVMAKGYEAEETTLHRVFDTGKYNCVSSSCVFYLVGTRLGLKLQPVLIPGTAYSAGHAAVDLLDDGKRIEIECTNPDGYDWPTKLKRPGVIAIGPQADRKKAYDSDGFGLASSIASNLGVAAVKADPPRPVEAIRWALVALVLDPTDGSAENNLLAAVTNWGLKVDEQKKFEDAVKVYAFGRNVLGSHKNLEHNYQVVWAHYLEAVFGEGKIADGLKLLPRATAAFPKDKKFANAAEWVSRAAGRKIDKDGWTAGLAFADVALKDLTGNPAADLRAWKDGVRRQWSQELLKKGDADGSLKVIADALAADPGNKELFAGLVFHAQEALAYLDAEKGMAAAAAHFKELCEKFPKAKEIRNKGYAVAARAVDKLADDKKFAEALKAAAAYEPLAGDRTDNLEQCTTSGARIWPRR